MSNELTHHASWHCLCQEEDKAGLGAGEGGGRVVRVGKLFQVGEEMALKQRARRTEGVSLGDVQGRAFKQGVQKVQRP